jgi:hypothetical protein
MSIVYFNLFECASGAAPYEELRHQTGHQTSVLSYFHSFIINYLNWASGAAPQQGIAAPDGAADFFYLFLLHIFNLYLFI